MVSLVEPDTKKQNESRSAGFRWEWRSFGKNFGAAEERIAQFAPSDPHESDEIYLLTGGGDNVKVRDNLMDIKVLREVNADGLEQWAPIMKAPFPMSRADAEKVLDALRISHLEALRDSYELDEFIEAFTGTGGNVRVVHVHKRRVRYTIEGCMAELSDVTANGMPTRTVAVEAEDGDAVVRAVEGLGLGGYENISYPRGLAALIDHAPECYAVIDLGTNSVKFHIGARDSSGVWQCIADRAELTRLGEGLSETGVISDAALDRTIAAISAMVDEARRNGVHAIAAVGTAGLRIAANSAEVLAAIRARTGVRVEVISGADEARLAFLATVDALGPTAGSLAVFDTGGGSSQFTFGHGTEVDERFSVNVGAARYTERFGLDRAVTEEDLAKAMVELATDLSQLNGRPAPDTLVGMGGAVTNIAAVSLGLAHYDPSRIQGAIVEASEIDRQIELYRSNDAEGRRSITGLQPKRAEVILAGACVVRTVLTKLRKTSLTVSDRGLRQGVLAERFGDGL